MGGQISPLNSAHPRREPAVSSATWLSLAHISLCIQNRLTIGSAVFAQLTRVPSTHTGTDHATRAASIATASIHERHAGDVDYFMHHPLQ